MDSYGLWINLSYSVYVISGVPQSEIVDIIYLYII